MATVTRQRPYATTSISAPDDSRNARLIARVMEQTDDLVVVIDYQGKDGAKTRRVVSPIRFEGSNRFLALCLAREEPRQFCLDRCTNVRVDLAGNYTMPVEMLTIEASA